MDEAIFSGPGHLIQRIGRLSQRWAEVRLQTLGLGVAQVPVLYALKDGNALSQKELAGRAAIEQPTMAQLLSRMERDGLIERTPDPEDGRSSRVSLTPPALGKLPAARAVLRAGSDEALAGLTAAEIDTLSLLLLRVMENMERATQAGSG